MKSKAKPFIIFDTIARIINREFNTLGGVDAEQVALVASGAEATMNHPIISAIRTELRKRKAMV